MPRRLIVAAALVLTAAPVLASDASADQRDLAAKVQTCTCSCRHEAKETAGQSQPKIDFGEAGRWPAN